MITEQEDLPLVLENFGHSREFPYAWTIACHLDGVPRKFTAFVGSSWIPIVWCARKNRYKGPPQPDFIEIEDRQAPEGISSTAYLENFHRSEEEKRIEIAKLLIAQYTKPNDLVVAPMLGKGAGAAVGALALGRKFFGVEASLDTFSEVRMLITKFTRPTPNDGKEGALPQVERAPVPAPAREVVNNVKM